MFCARYFNCIIKPAVQLRVRLAAYLPVCALALVFRVLMVVLVFAGSAAQAQYNTMRMNFDGTSSQSGFGLTGGVSMDVPMHNLNEVYKASPAGEIGLQYYLKKSWVFGLHGSYRVLQPKQSVIYDVDEFGTVYSATSYGGYVTYGIFLSAAYQVPISRRTRFVGGINAGNYYSSFKFISLDVASNTYYAGSLSEPQGYIAPKLGLSYQLNEDVSLGIHTQYNVFGSYSSYNYDNIDGVSSSGSVYTSWASGVSLSYRFP